MNSEGVFSGRLPIVAIGRIPNNQIKGIIRNRNIFKSTIKNISITLMQTLSNLGSDMVFFSNSLVSQVHQLLPVDILLPSRIDLEAYSKYYYHQPEQITL